MVNNSQRGSSFAKWMRRLEESGDEFQAVQDEPLKKELVTTNYSALILEPVGEQRSNPAQEEDLKREESGEIRDAPSDEQPLPTDPMRTKNSILERMTKLIESNKLQLKEIDEETLKEIGESDFSRFLLGDDLLKIGIQKYSSFKLLDEQGLNYDSDTSESSNEVKHNQNENLDMVPSMESDTESTEQRQDVNRTYREENETYSFLQQYSSSEESQFSQALEDLLKQRQEFVSMFAKEFERSKGRPSKRKQTNALQDAGIPRPSLETRGVPNSAKQDSGPLSVVVPAADAQADPNCAQPGVRRLGSNARKSNASPPHSKNSSTESKEKNFLEAGSIGGNSADLPDKSIQSKMHESIETSGDYDGTSNEGSNSPFQKDKYSTSKPCSGDSQRNTRVRCGLIPRLDSTALPTPSPSHIPTVDPSQSKISISKAVTKQSIPSWARKKLTMRNVANKQSVKSDKFNGKATVADLQILPPKSKHKKSGQLDSLSLKKITMKNKERSVRVRLGSKSMKVSDTPSEEVHEGSGKNTTTKEIDDSNEQKPDQKTLDQNRDGQAVQKVSTVFDMPILPERHPETIDDSTQNDDVSEKSVSLTNNEDMADMIWWSDVTHAVEIIAVKSDGFEVARQQQIRVEEEETQMKDIKNDAKEATAETITDDDETNSAEAKTTESVSVPKTPDTCRAEKKPNVIFAEHEDVDEDNDLQQIRYDITLEEKGDESSSVSSEDYEPKIITLENGRREKKRREKKERGRLRQKRSRQRIPRAASDLSEIQCAFMPKDDTAFCNDVDLVDEDEDDVDATGCKTFTSDLKDMLKEVIREGPIVVARWL